MNTNRSTNLLRIALLCMVLAFLVILMTIPLLAKGISGVVGDPIQPEKLDIRPIPVPVPPESLAMNAPRASETPAPPLQAVAVIPVPTPEVAISTNKNVAQNAIYESSNGLMVPTVNRQTVVLIVLSLTVLLILVGLQRMPSIHSWHGKNAQ